MAPLSSLIGLLKRENNVLEAENSTLKTHNERSREELQQEKARNKQEVFQCQVIQVYTQLQLDQARQVQKQWADVVQGLNQQLAEANNFLPWGDDFVATMGQRWYKRHESRYTNVKVLMVRWASDNLGVSKEIYHLRRVFKEYYDFEVSDFRIPDHQPTATLANRVRKFTGNHSPETLLIFYYAGHGGINRSTHDHCWSAT